jgi:glyoxylase-like metal-dependent hydrolase (beta-lactamase superfamily II)
MQLVFEQIPVGGDRNFGYLLGDRVARQAVLIDPSYSPESLVNRAAEQGLKVMHIVNTHGHPDHVNGNQRAVELTHAPVAAHPLLQPELSLRDNDRLAVGSMSLKILHVPGHADDHLALFDEANRILITGDLLFVGKVGGTKTEADARAEWHSLRRLVAEIPSDATVWPGHDYGARPSSSMALELKTNPFLICPDLDAFLSLKSNWAAFKKEHGLR